MSHLCHPSHRPTLGFFIKLSNLNSFGWVEGCCTWRPKHIRKYSVGNCPQSCVWMLARRLDPFLTCVICLTTLPRAFTSVWGETGFKLTGTALAGDLLPLVHLRWGPRHIRLYSVGTCPQHWLTILKGVHILWMSVITRTRISAACGPGERV